MNKIGVITKDFIFESSENKPNYMEQINQFTRKTLTEDEVYVFPVTLCNNDIDRDTEMFTVESLNRLADLFIGKTGIVDHDWSSNNQVARIFSTSVNKVEGKKTQTGEDFYELRALCYMLRNEKNQPMIDEIEAGIKKEVSVGCSCGRSTCSICGKDFWYDEDCYHYKGRVYDGKTCYVKLENPLDAYEFSFVAIPAQKEAGVTKAFDKKSNKEKEKMFVYNESLKQFGIDEETFKGFDLEPEKVEKIAKSVKIEQPEEYISKAKVVEELGEEKTAEEVLNLAKEAAQYKDNANKYTKLFNAKIEEALKEGVKAKGEDFNSDRWGKILNSFSYEEVEGQMEEWHNEAEKALNGGKRVSEPSTRVKTTKLTEQDINF